MVIAANTLPLCVARAIVTARSRFHVAEDHPRKATRTAQFVMGIMMPDASPITQCER